MKLFLSISMFMITFCCSSRLFSQSEVMLPDENKPGIVIPKIFKPSDSILSNSTFLKTITEKRNACESMITRLISKKLDSSNHKSIYEEVRKSYNTILEKMDGDISRMDNLAEFALSNTSEYQEELKEAEVLERKFLAEGGLRLGQDASILSEIFKEVIDFLPGVKQIHDLTLKVFKKRLRTKIKNSRFHKWEVVGMM